MLPQRTCGRPEGIDGYEVTLPDIRGGWDDHMVKGFKETSHELGLTPKQVQGILNFYGPALDTIIAGSERDHHNEQVAATQALKEKYGAAYDQKVAVAKAALENYADEGLMGRLTDAGFLNDAGFIEVFANVGELLQEDGYITGYVEGATTKESAQEELAKITGDPKGPYWDRFRGSIR
jgi:phosphoglycolate phosphatase-like HAD superfamily hydrolase